MGINCRSGRPTRRGRNGTLQADDWLISGIDSAEDVEFGFVLLQQARGPHNFIECAGAALVVAIGIVSVARSVDAQADEKVIFMEKARTTRH